MNTPSNTSNEVKTVEEWRPIQGFEGMYEVSNQGNVASITRKTAGRWGNMKTSPGRVLKGETTKNGYVRVYLSSDGKSKRHLVHRLVASTFIENIDGKPCVNHIDFNRTNNSVDNLEWTTYAENTNHSHTAGRLKPSPLKEYCIRGHSMNDDNTRTRSFRGKPSRYCIACRRANYHEKCKELRTTLKAVLYGEKK